MMISTLELERPRDQSGCLSICACIGGGEIPRATPLKCELGESGGGGYMFIYRFEDVSD